MVEPIQSVGVATSRAPAPNVPNSPSAVESIQQDAQKRNNPSAGIQHEAQEQLDPSNLFEPRNTGIHFRAIDNPRLIQSRVIDHNTDEVLREVPSTDRLRFSRRFRESVSKFVGQNLDLKA